MLRQDFIRVSPIVGVYLCVNNVNFNDTHPTRGAKDEHSCIPTEVRSSLIFLCIEIPPVWPFSIHPSLQWDSLRLLLKPHVLWVFWSVHLGFTPPQKSLRNTFSEDYPETYNPLPCVTARMLRCKWVSSDITCQGGFLEGYIKATPQVVPELLPGNVSTILGSKQNSDPPTSFTCPFHIQFCLLSCSHLHGYYLPFLPIHCNLAMSKGSDLSYKLDFAITFF